MTDAQEMKELLREILDVQKAHLMAYQSVSDRALAVQHIAVEQQTQAIRRQRIALWTIGLVAVLAVFVLVGAR